MTKRVRDKGRKAIEKKTKALEVLKIEYVSVEDLYPNSYNPNEQDEHEFNLLLKSIEEDGFTQPPLVCRVMEETKDDPAFSYAPGVGSLVIVDGEHRWRAGIQLGYPAIPVVITDMTPAQLRISTLRHNRARGNEDIERTAAVLRDLQSLGAMDWAQDSLELTDVEINRLIDDTPVPEVLAGDEFGEAWVPESGDTVSVERDLVAGQGRAVGMSRDASTVMRERERRLAAAKTEEEWAKVKQDTNVYRLVLVFSGDEGKLVKETLGAQPANWILAKCRENGDAQ